MIRPWRQLAGRYRTWRTRVARPPGAHSADARRGWAGPTAVYPRTGPLMTRGQAHRSRP